MKFFILAAALIIGTGPLTTGANGFSSVQKNRVPNATYIPTGFDDNDNTQLVFEGFYPNSCYKVGLTSHEVDHQAMEIKVIDTTYFYENALCTMVIIPYSKEVDFGLLPKGNYKVLFKNSDNELIEYGHLNVNKASSDQMDDFLYAPVDQAVFKASQANKPATLTLSGRFYNSCMSMDKVTVEHQAGSNTIHVLPIVKLLQQEDCADLDIPKQFVEVVEIKGFSEGRYLLHTRSLNGKAVNRIVNLK